MLRLKQALIDCGIQQKAVVAYTGFGKTQVSLSLSSGKLPADAERFKDGVVKLVGESKLFAWLDEHGMNVDQLFEDVGNPPRSPFHEVGSEEDLNQSLYNIAGRAALDGGLSRTTALRLVRAVHFLSLTARPELAREAAVILAGGGS